MLALIAGHKRHLMARKRQLAELACQLNVELNQSCSTADNSGSSDEEFNFNFDDGSQEVVGLKRPRQYVHYDKKQRRKDVGLDDGFEVNLTKKTCFKDPFAWQGREPPPGPEAAKILDSEQQFPRPSYTARRRTINWTLAADEILIHLVRSLDLDDVLPESDPKAPVDEAAEEDFVYLRTQTIDTRWSWIRDLLERLPLANGGIASFLRPDGTELVGQAYRGYEPLSTMEVKCHYTNIIKTPKTDVHNFTEREHAILLKCLSKLFGLTSHDTISSGKNQQLEAKNPWINLAFHLPGRSPFVCLQRCQQFTDFSVSAKRLYKGSKERLILDAVVEVVGPASHLSVVQLVNTVVDISFNGLPVADNIVSSDRIFDRQLSNVIRTLNDVRSFNRIPWATPLKGRAFRMTGFLGVDTIRGYLIRYRLERSDCLLTSAEAENAGNNLSPDTRMLAEFAASSILEKMGDSIEERHYVLAYDGYLRAHQIYGCQGSPATFRVFQRLVTAVKLDRMRRPSMCESSREPTARVLSPTPAPVNADLQTKEYSESPFATNSDDSRPIAERLNFKRLNVNRSSAYAAYPLSKIRTSLQTFIK
eukprot:GILI01020372.1.p1 GENE.GILI01020372.1~~GILI01020372.1.p1  ORF type:complete len:611 (+),score=-9.71 GILI01020372.1:65-1834(+)